ncbi:MAG: NDP-sugar synthase [Proteobacteria bacterium]|nr:NDP-sugar synthase [Pseudomonadota bacterium]
MSELLHGIVLAAGHSTRLGALGHERPKPLLPVCNEPLLRWALALLQRAGVVEVSVNAHHLGGQLAALVGAEAAGGLALELVAETELLGTGGGIKAMARRAPERSCLVVNGKLVCDVELAAVAAFHREQRALATLVVYPHPHAKAWGAIGVDAAQRVGRILEQEAPTTGPLTDYLFTGIQLLEPEAVAAIPAGPCCVMRTALSALLRAGAPLAAWVHRGYFYEHSTIPRYLQGNLNLLAGAAPTAPRPGPVRGVDPSAVLGRGSTLVEPVLIGRGAVVGAGARVGPAVVLGAGAQVHEGVSVAEAVVWPEAHLRHSTRRVVVTPLQVVPVELDADPTAAPR